METSETKYERNGERERTAALLDFETLQKTKISSHWQADRSGP